jgi:hypothetical protein
LNIGLGFFGRLVDMPNAENGGGYIREPQIGVAQADQGLRKPERYRRQPTRILIAKE